MAWKTSTRPKSNSIRYVTWPSGNCSSKVYSRFDSIAKHVFAIWRQDKCWNRRVELEAFSWSFLVLIYYYICGAVKFHLSCFCRVFIFNHTTITALGAVGLHLLGAICKKGITKERFSIHDRKREKEDIMLVHIIVPLNTLILHIANRRLQAIEYFKLVLPLFAFYYLVSSRLVLSCLRRVVFLSTKNLSFRFHGPVHASSPFLPQSLKLDSLLWSSYEALCDLGSSRGLPTCVNFCVDFFLTNASLSLSLSLSWSWSYLLMWYPLYSKEQMRMSCLRLTFKRKKIWKVSAGGWGWGLGWSLGWVLGEV